MQERELEGYDDALDAFMDSIVASLTPEERLAGLTAQEVVSSMRLSARDLLAALPESERRELRALLAREECD